MLKAKHFLPSFGSVKATLEQILVILLAFCCVCCYNLIILMISFGARTLGPLRESHARVNFEDLLRRWGQSGVWPWQSCFPWMLPRNNTKHNDTDREMMGGSEILCLFYAFDYFSMRGYFTANVYLIFTLIFIWLYFMKVNSAPVLFFLFLHFNNESFVKIKWFIASPQLLLFSQPLSESSKTRDQVIASTESEFFGLHYMNLYISIALLVL